MSTDPALDSAGRRRETRIVKAYLARIQAQQTGMRGRNADEIQTELETIETKLETANDIERLELLQQRENLHKQLLGAAPQNDELLEEQFIAVAKAYGERKKISYSTWREFGVPKNVLEQAGVPRTRRPNQRRLKH